MEASPEVRQKLALIIGNLICRCLEQARKVPYVLDREHVVEMLVENPAFFAELVREEQRDRSEYSHDRLTAKIDAVTELSQLEALDAFDVSFHGALDSDADLAPVLERINQLTRTFMVYAGNMVTIFEKEFQHFIEKFRQSMQQAGLTLETMELAPEDMARLEERAEAYLNDGQFLQAFSFDRLLNSDVMTRELICPAAAGYSLGEKLIRSAMSQAHLRDSLIVFILRACSISQGSWQDLFTMLVKSIDEKPEWGGRAMLAERIEQDGVFCCNLLCESFANLKSWPAADRRSAIEKKLETWPPQ